MAAPADGFDACRLFSAQDVPLPSSTPDSRSRSRSRKPGRADVARTARDGSRASAFSTALSWTLLILAALIVKGTVWAQLGNHPLLAPRGDLDTAYYIQLAQRVAAGDLNLSGEPFFVSPLYIYVLAAALTLTGGSLVAAQLLQLVGGIAAVCLTAWTAGQWFGPRARWIAGALSIATGAITFNELLILQSSLDPILMAAWLAALTRALLDERPIALTPISGPAIWWTATGALIALHALNRPNVLLCGLVLLAALPLLSGVRRGAGRALACALGLALVLTPLLLRNVASTGEPILISAHGGLNFYMGNRPGATGAYDSLEGITPSIQGQVRDARRVAEAAAGRTLSEGEVSEHFYRLGRDWWRAHPRDAVALLARKVWYALNAVDLSLNYSYTYFARDERSLLSLLVVGPWCLVPLGLVGLFAPRAAHATARTFAVWALMIPAFVLAVALFFVSGRYRLPLLTPLCVTSAATLLWTWDAVRLARGRTLAALAAAVLVLAVGVNWPTGLDDGRAAQRVDRVEVLIANGEDARAQALLDETKALQAQPGLMYYRAGRAWQARGASASAVAAYRQALTYDPGQAEIQFNLGETLAAMGQRAAAVPHLEAACRARVRVARCAGTLGQVLVDLGRAGDAAALLARTSPPTETTAGEWAALGAFALTLHRPEVAEPWLREAITRDPNVAGVHEQLGLALMLRDRAGEAVDAFETAARLDPSNPRIFYNLAVARVSLGQRDEARAAVAKAILIDPVYAAARALQRELDR